MKICVGKKQLRMGVLISPLYYRRQTVDGVDVEGGYHFSYFMRGRMLTEREKCAFCGCFHEMHPG
jgi:hypothetical protein